MRLTLCFTLPAVFALCSFAWPSASTQPAPYQQLPFVCGTGTSVKLDSPLVNHVPSVGGPPTITEVRTRWEDTFVNSTTCKEEDCGFSPNACAPWADMSWASYTITPHPSTPDLYVVTIIGAEMDYGCHDC